LADEPNEAGASQGTQRPLKARRPRVAAPELQIAVAGVKLTHPDRILYPEERVNKRMLAEYYEAVAPAMLPHLQNRPLSIYRCPGGIEKESFFQKQLGEMSSPYLRGAKAGDDPYLVLDGAAGLVTLAQWSTLEIHGWGCREPDLDHPDLIVFDLDPGPNVPWPQIVEGAKGLRLLLDELGLHSFVKTSGGKGLHVVVPLSSNQRSSLTKGGRIDESAALPRTKRAQSRVSETTASSADRGGRGVLGSRPGSPPPADPPTLTQDWDVVKDFAARVSRKITQVAPKHFTVFMSKPERRGKVFIDYHRNHRGSTCVMPYSTRARPGAFVSTPLDWSELDGPQPRFHIFDVLERLENRQGSTAPWSDFFQIKQGITPDALEWLRAGRRDS
jgi:bifunctional non-homologous end joining protein LigD